ncbi:putative trkH-domain-containing protein [Lyophyllum shimeji]|uniref:TrkH-domain-containing protein n=1 Tax=Lyophyllum shimeji TaxID=47721 RepID=A0A9P3PLN8_LYOSH|nr:putative trkH-domain-containing protein [Lyophyllum shimeji]
MFYFNIAIRDGVSWLRRELKQHLNFYRIHVMYIILTPLIFAAIFYGSNGRYPVAFIDALFACVSAMTVCGLITVNLSALTGWQQAIMFLLMSIGNPVVVSWAILLLRRHYFAIKFRHVLKASAEKRAAEASADPEQRASQWPRRVSTFLRRQPNSEAEGDTERGGERHKGRAEKSRPDMIRKGDNEARNINPSNFSTVPLREKSTVNGGQTGQLSSIASSRNSEHASRRSGSGHDERRYYPRLSDPGSRPSRASPSEAPFSRSYTMHGRAASGSPPRPESLEPSDLPQMARSVAVGRQERLRTSSKRDDKRDHILPLPTPIDQLTVVVDLSLARLL